MNLLRGIKNGVLALLGAGLVLGQTACKSVDELEKELHSNGSPYVQAVVPSGAAVGQQIGLLGFNFGTTPGKVAFSTRAGTTEVVPDSWTNDTIIVKVPEVGGLTQSSVSMTTADGKMPPFTSTVAVTGPEPGPSPSPSP